MSSGKARSYFSTTRYRPDYIALNPFFNMEGAHPSMARTTQ